MSVRVEHGIIGLSGACGAADAELLLRMLQEKPGRTIDVSQAGHLHAAVVQVLLAFRPDVYGEAGDAFLTTWVLPLLRGNEDRKVG